MSFFIDDAKVRKFPDICKF